MRSVIVPFALLVSAMTALGQQEVTIGEISRHVLPHPPPSLPAVARDALVDGTVDLRITIDPQGKVSAATFSGGPDLLRDAAISVVQGWSFRPFRSPQGRPIAVMGQIEVKFILTPADMSRRSIQQEQDNRTAALFFPASDRCHAAVRSGAANGNDHACIDAAELAKKFPSADRFIERRAAFVYAALWFLQNNDGEKALPYAQLAVDEIKKGHDDESGSNSAYTVRGESEALLGQFEQANDDLRTAEELERRAITWAATASDAAMLTSNYKATLRRNLRVRANVLRRLGNATEAEAQEAELRSITGRN